MDSARFIAFQTLFCFGGIASVGGEEGHVRYVSFDEAIIVPIYLLLRVIERVKMPLPSGQHEVDKLHRFGLPQYAKRFPEKPDDRSLRIIIGSEQFEMTHEEFDQLPHAEQISDFHCVTTWSVTDLKWEGVRFSDFYEALIAPRLPGDELDHVVFHAQDGYRARLKLEYLLAPDVMLAVTLNGEPLPIAHGAPMRLIAPQHYGYKNLKHVNQIGFHTDWSTFKPPRRKFLEHVDARVAFEERGMGYPGWFLRYLYRPLIGGTRRDFKKALEKYEAEQ